MFNTIPKGLKYALIAAIISGVSIFVNKFAIDVITPPLLFTAVKNTGVGLMLLPILFFTGKLDKLKKIKSKELIYLFLIGIVGGAIPFYLFFTGLSMIPAVSAGIIQKTLVFWVILLAIPFLKEKITKKQFMAIILLFIGNIFIGGFSGFIFSQGEYFILLATFFWSGEIILAKKILPRVDPDIVTAARMLFGSAILLLTAIISVPNILNKTVNFNPNQFFWIILTMVFLFGYVTFWYRALKYAPAIIVTAILVSSTLVTNLLSAIFITQSLTLGILIQSILIFLGTGILITNLKKEKLKNKRFLFK